MAQHSKHHVVFARSVYIMLLIFQCPLLLEQLVFGLVPFLSISQVFKGINHRRKNASRTSCHDHVKQFYNTDFPLSSAEVPWGFSRGAGEQARELNLLETGEENGDPPRALFSLSLCLCLCLCLSHCVCESISLSLSLSLSVSVSVSVCLCLCLSLSV